MSVLIFRGVCKVSDNLWLRLTARLKMKQDSKKLKRKLLYLTTIILTLAGCASEDYVGNRELHEANENGRPVSFSLAAAPQTRAVSGQEAADLLNNNFVVWGDKTVNSATQTVFDNYQVNYVTNTASTTITNSTGWEYVGYKNLPNGTSTTLGIDQTIKFWDYGASQYHFFAYSLGKGVEVTPATDPKTYTYATTTAMNTGGYTLSGTGDQLKACYISDKKTISPSGSSGTQVELQFRNFASNVKMAFYETILGYSVNNVQFYPAVDGTVGDVPYLYASSSALPTAGTYAVSFDETSGKAQVSAPTGGSNASNLAFGTALTYTAGKEYREPQTDGTTPYIGRASNAATPTTAVTVLPNPSGTDLHLKVDYTLVARDGYGETIHVRGATATVPAAYTKWQPNYSYTYLFKISDNTNGTTGQDILGLSPITLDAVVNTDTEGRQETVTTVTNPSITTYQKGSDYATTDEYDAGIIYVMVTGGSGIATLSATNAKLYKVTLADPDVDNALVTETVAANAIANPTGAKDANGNDMMVTAVASSDEDALSLTNEIAAADSPDGKAVVFRTPEEGEDPVIYKAAKFTATARTIYVFEYTDTTPEPDMKYYKVIKVAPAS